MIDLGWYTATVIAKQYAKIFGLRKDYSYQYMRQRLKSMVGYTGSAFRPLDGSDGKRAIPLSTKYLQYARLWFVGLLFIAVR